MASRTREGSAARPDPFASLHTMHTVEYYGLLYHGDLTVPGAAASLKRVHRAGGWLMLLPKAQAKELVKNRLIESALIGWRVTPRGIAYARELETRDEVEKPGVRIRKSAAPADLYRDRLLQTLRQGTDRLPRRPADLSLRPQPER